jgi:anti-sigma factor RsiW
MKWRGRRSSLRCRDAVELITDYIEDALAPNGRRKLDEHLAGCPHCSEYLAQMRATIATSGRVDPDSLTPDVQRTLIALYRVWQQSS